MEILDVIDKVVKLPRWHNISKLAYKPSACMLDHVFAGLCEWENRITKSA
jgi:hypothetical protein